MLQNRYYLKKVSTGAEIELVGAMTAGHVPECQLQLQVGGPEGSRPSRRHARISLTDDVVAVEDLQSTNGTYINGTRITGRTPLRSGDRVRFDVEEFELRAEPVAPPDDRTQQRVAGPVDAVAVSGDANQVPPAWVVGGAGGGKEGKTQFITEEELERMRKQALSADSPAQQEAVDDGVPYLLVQTGSRAGAHITLRGAGAAKKEWSVGSDPDRQVVLADAGVSGKHAKIVNEGDRWKLIDQLASNGTFVNGVRTNASFLTSGDRLQFGPVECVFHLQGQASAALQSPKRRLVRFAAIAMITLVVVACATWLLLKH